MDSTTQGSEKGKTLKERAQAMLEDQTLLMGMFEGDENQPKWFAYLKDKVPSEAIIATLMDKALNEKDVKAIETLNKIAEDKSASIELPDSFFDSNKDVKIEIITPKMSKEDILAEAEKEGGDVSE